MTDLKPIEIELIQLTAQGLGAKEISVITKMKPLTVDTYLCRLRYSLKVRNRAHLVSWAYQQGILKVEEVSYETV